MRSFKSFNEQLFNNVDIKWFDAKGLYRLDENRVAEISLRTNWNSSIYDSYFVEVKHKENGKIACHNFEFMDYMHISERVDNRGIYRGAFTVEFDNEKFGWFVAIPSTDAKTRLTSAIIDYIESYR
jgi:hypothetical protein